GKLLSGQKHGEQWNWETVSLPGVMPQGQHCADGEGRIWYLRGEQEIGIWSAGETKTLARPSGLESQRIKILTADAQGHIWVGTDRALAEWQSDHFAVMTPTNGEAGLRVKRIVPSGGGDLWVEANGRMRRCAGRRWLAESEGWNAELGKLGTLRFLHGDAKGGLWSGVGDLGLIHVLEDGTFHRLTTKDGLPSNTIHFAFQDHDGNTWTGYERGGLVQVRRRLFRAIGKGEGLNENLINTVSEDKQGAVWIGTHGGTVGRCENGVCTNLMVPSAAHVQDSIAVADAQGRVWIGAQGAGLLLREAGEVRRIATPTELQGYARLMVPARDGRLWVGSVWSIAFVEGEKLTRVYEALTTGDHPTALAEAADGTIWAGTLAGQLLRWDGRQFVPVEPPDRSSLGRIWALWPAPDGGLWAGTAEGGLLHLRDGKFHRFTTKDGLPSDCIVQILGDAQGNLWLGTRSGIVRIVDAALTRFERGELGELPVSVYGQTDGLLTIGSAIIFQPNCWRGRDGTLFFAMVNSVAAVNPEEAHVNPLPPTVVLEEFRADEKRLWPARAGAVLFAERATNGNQAVSIPTIKVRPGAGDLEFGYAGLSLRSPSRVRFKYRLEGLETDWSEARGERRAFYRHVPPGDYVFRVIACNSDCLWSDDGALVAVTVEPHFYQTAWFQGGAGLLAAAGLTLAVVTTTRRRMHRRLEQLERQRGLERERARIAQDLHDDLGAGLTEIGLLGGLLQNPAAIPERRHLALERIVQRCRDLVVALDEIVWAVNPRNDSVNSLSGYLSQYAQSFLEPTSIGCRLEIQDVETVHPLSSEQRHNLFLAFKESLTNLVRHSGATEVSIRIFIEGTDRLLICIADNGRGLPLEISEGADGLINLRRRMTQIGGQFEITNPQAGGVVVRLSLPLTAPETNSHPAQKTK
ncbi:MAG: hypothetical protein EPO07_08580, partial [Verrucomicrobia bacterium]